MCACVCVWERAREMREYVFMFISEEQSYVVVFKAFDCEVLTVQGVQQTKTKSIRINPAG